MASVDLESLLLSSPRTARELALALGVSQPTVSRRLAEQGERVLAIGQARTRRYAWRRPVRDIGWEWPVYRVDGEGGISLAGRLHAIYPAGYVWRDELSQQESVFDGLPWFLADNRPQGYLGRKLAALYSQDMLPLRLGDWSDEEILICMCKYGHELNGNFLVGAWSLQMYRALVDGLRLMGDRLVTRASSRGMYPASVRGNLSADNTANSSIAGEQPKLAFYLRSDEGEAMELLIKFTPPRDLESGLRWSDLLVAECLASEVLRDYGISSSGSEVVQVEGRAFLEVVRFDRTPAYGRLGIVSMEAVSNEFIGHAQGWDEQAASLLEQHLISQQDYDRILRIHAFGNLIANTDMHPGNLSFFLGDDFSLLLAPVYDMLPMHHAPNTHGEVIDRPVRQSRPTPLTESVWPEVRGWALDYWSRVADDNRISDDFRRLAEAYHAELSRQTEFS